jgi:hypothetical protein
VKQLQFEPVKNDAETEKLSGTFLQESDFHTLIRDESTTVLKEDGSPLLMYVKGAIPQSAIKAAYGPLKEAATMGGASNRGVAQGKGRIISPNGKVLALFNEDAAKVNPLKSDGTFSKTNYSIKAPNILELIKKNNAKLEMLQSDGTYKEIPAKRDEFGIIGYMDKNPRFPYCRLTAYNINNPQRFGAAMPLIRSVDACFAEYAPERYAAQRGAIEQTHDDFYISGTVFTTITVNLSWQTAVHTDKGDYKPGFGVLTAMRKGSFGGCYFTLPKYGVAVDMQTSDVLLVDVHEWHGNTPIVPKGRYERLSMVFYYREKMMECASPEEELERAKREKGNSHVAGFRNE